MVFDVRGYIWNIFLISKYNKVDVQLAYDLFITNVTFGMERYPGAENVNYKALNRKWMELSDNKKEYQKKIYNAVLDCLSVDLYDCWRKGNKKLFESLCRTTDLGKYGIRYKYPKSTRSTNNTIKKKRKLPRKANPQ